MSFVNSSVTTTSSSAWAVFANAKGSDRMRPSSRVLISMTRMISPGAEKTNGA